MHCPDRAQEYRYKIMTATTFNVEIKRQSLAELIRDELRSRIIDGRLGPGERLVESHLSEAMAVSRVPVREALRALAAEGLVEIKPRKGASVAILDDDTVAHLVEVRAFLEGLNARLAAERRVKSDIAKLNAILQRGTSASEKEDYTACATLNREFHETLGNISKNPVLIEMMTSVRDRTAVVFAESNHTRARSQRNWEDHARILRAVIAGNVQEAQEYAMQHVHSAAQGYREYAAAMQARHASGVRDRPSASHIPLNHASHKAPQEA